MDFFFINAGARTISKNILFDYAVPYPCYVSCASIERNARYYVLLYRFARIVCVFTLSTHWFEWFLVSGFVMFLLFSIHWNVFPFFLYLNHKCVRIAWLNFPYCPYALDSTEFLRRENCVLFFFRFVVFSHFPFVIGATNCLCTFVLATIVACRCHTYNHVNRISCLFFHVLFLFFCLTLTSLCFSFSFPLFSHSLRFLSIFFCYYLSFIFSSFVILNKCFQR